jgi:DNA polymerase-3 subunit gamma/tau
MSGEGSVVEVDASFFGLVDNIRALRDQLQMYSISAYKVVILDEAHMMSKEAFNVLLKLLEEPPEKTLFILCTTESEKVLETVRSRLLEFRFTAINRDKVLGYLLALTEREKVKCDTAVFERLYRLSNDNLRDVIVSLEQLALLGEGEVTKELTAKTFGDIFVFEKILDGIRSGDYGIVMELYREYNSFYTDFLRFLNGFLTIAGDRFLVAIKMGSQDVLFYSTLFRAIYKFQQMTLSLKGEAAAGLFFHSIIMEVAGEVTTQTLVSKEVLTEEEALDLLMVDKS